MLGQHDTARPGSLDAGRGRNPTGGRRREADYYAAQDRAAVSSELPPDMDRFAPVRLLRRGGLARLLGWPNRLVDHLELLIGWTAPIDWEPGNRRMRRRSGTRAAEALGVSEGDYIRKCHWDTHASGSDPRILY